MRAILLAAGRGSRMGSLTREQPKCLTPLDGRPLVEWQLQALRGGGAGDIAVVTGYMGHLLDGYGLRRFENPRWAETQMVRSLACAAEWLREGPCLVSYSDIVYEPAVVRTLAAAPGELAISYHTGWLDIWKARFDDPLSDAETFRVADDGRLLEIGRRATHLGDIQGQYMGLLRFTPRAWADVEALLASLEPAVADKVDMTSLLGRLLAAGVRIDATPVSGEWWEVDNEHDLRVYEARLAAARGLL